MESDIRATVDSVMSQLASLESSTSQVTKADNYGSSMLSGATAKKDILQQALKNSGLPSKNRTLCEGTLEDRKVVTS